MYLSNPFDLAYQGVGDLHGGESVTFVVPNIPGLPGMTVSTQAVTVDRDGGFRLSNGAQTLINLRSEERDPGRAPARPVARPGRVRSTAPGPAPFSLESPNPVRTLSRTPLR